ncbi:MAG: four helix bundle protein [Chloroflexi bacterium]|nr:four helix bundle protein [Chloroflexota bacterium]
MPYQDIEESRMYQRAEQIGDTIWNAVMQWKPFAQNSLGEQLTTAADSIGANIAESSGRFTPPDAIRFLYYSRGSIWETRFWLKRAIKRNLISQEFFDAQFAELKTISAELNSYIGYQRTRIAKESSADFDTNEPTNQPSNKPKKVTYATRKRQRH